MKYRREPLIHFLTGSSCPNGSGLTTRRTRCRIADLQASGLHLVKVLTGRGDVMVDAFAWFTRWQRWLQSRSGRLLGYLWLGALAGALLLSA
jgi:hypothetical protein